MSLAKVLAPERIALASAYTEEEAREELAAVLPLLTDEHGSACIPGVDGCGKGCPGQEGLDAVGDATSLVSLYRGVTCG